MLGGCTFTTLFVFAEREDSIDAIFVAIDDETKALLPFGGHFTLNGWACDLSGCCCWLEFWGGALVHANTSSASKTISQPCIVQHLCNALRSGWKQPNNKSDTLQKHLVITALCFWHFNFLHKKVKNCFFSELFSILINSINSKCNRQILAFRWRVTN